jgi:phosphopantothenoylcysteine decarboxylase / phosphopantothenate---cysteine ligase
VLKVRRLLVAIGGGIAAYKVCEVISNLHQAGYEVRVILTTRAEQFITPLTVATLSRHPAYTDELFWQSNHSRPLHIELAEWAELLLIAPLTANTLAKLTYGLADNLLTNTVLASSCPILLAPAMNTEMWHQPSVQRNWHQLQQDPRYHSLGPDSGRLACDTFGTGRMANPQAIITAIAALFESMGKRDLLGKRILVTAGGTQEYLDPVRYLGNPSTGKMGLALAVAAHYRGAEVILVHANVDPSLLNSLPNLVHYPLTTAQDLLDTILQELPTIDWLCMTAAVADVKPAQYHPFKLAKADLPEKLALEPVVDILKTLSSKKMPQQSFIGFAAQSGDIIPPAREKLKQKNLDVIVANPIDQNGVGFGSDNNQGIFLDRLGRELRINFCTKIEMANLLLDFVQEYLNLTAHL